MPFPFEAEFTELNSDLDVYIDAAFGALRSEFLTLPKGDGFIEYSVFEQGYEALKRATSGFRQLSSDQIVETVREVPISFIVLRTKLGFTLTCPLVPFR